MVDITPITTGGTFLAPDKGDKFYMAVINFSKEEILEKECNHIINLIASSIDCQLNLVKSLPGFSEKHLEMIIWNLEAIIRSELVKFRIEQLPMGAPFIEEELKEKSNG